jgi:HlyD family secretion protein
VNSKNLERTQAQSDKGLVSPQQLETAKLQVKTRQAAINSSEKQLVQAEAQLNQAKLNVSYCTIKAPIDGVIVDRRVDVGVTVQSSMTTPQFFTIATDLTTLKLSAGVDEADIGYIRRNMEVTFTVDSYPGVNFVGSVDAVRLNATTNQNVVTYPVWITVQNPDLLLRPSMTANLKIIVDRAANVMRVPNQALRFRPTIDIYTWLGMTPPAAGQGRGRGANAVVDATGARGGNANVQAAGGARTAGPQPAGGQRGDDLQANAGTGGGNPNRRQRNQGGQTQFRNGTWWPGAPGAGRQGQGGQGFDRIASPVRAAAVRIGRLGRATARTGRARAAGSLVAARADRTARWAVRGVAEAAADSARRVCRT